MAPWYCMSSQVDFMLILMTIIESNGSDKISIFVCQQQQQPSTWIEMKEKHEEKNDVDRSFSWDFNTVLPEHSAMQKCEAGAQTPKIFSVLIRHLRKCDEKDVKIFAHKL